MSTPALESAALVLHLHARDAELPAGVALNAVAGARAVLVQDAAHVPAGSGLHVHVALPDRSRAELRWVVDQIVRRVGALASIGHREIRCDHGVDDDALLALALDMRQRGAGQGGVTLADRPEVQQRLDTVGRLEDLYRGWVNEDPAVRTSLAIARDICDWAGGHGSVSVDVLAESELSRLGLRLLLAVGAGSKASPPRLVIARYRPPGAAGAPLMLLGKGITFDSGGINVKPYESYVSAMKNDMAGAALAYAVFRGLVEAGHSEPLLLVIPTCENAIDAESMRPGALVKSYRGVTVRVDHTDAEGRLALADGLAYATDVYDPRQVLCFATLTTAALIAYGPYATPVHFADAALAARLAAAAEQTGEDLHFFPERVWHFEANRDREADLRNTARLPGDAARGAGSRNAAHFLKHFSDAPLCHFDIFASAWNWAGDAPGTAYGATGAPLRTLLRAFGVG